MLFPINNVSYFTKFYYEGWKAAVCNPTSRMCGISEKYHTVVKNEAISQSGISKMYWMVLVKQISNAIIIFNCRPVTQ